MRSPDATTGHSRLERSACTVCGSADLHLHQRSRATGRATLECRRCRVRALAEFPTTDEMVELTEHDQDEFAAWAALTRGEEIEQSHAEVLEHIGRLLHVDGRPHVWDVGAGAGNFLALAQRSGYEATGNDLAPGAVRLVKDRHDIDLQLGDLADLDLAPTQDAVTLWCVLAHVVDGNGLLSNAARLLRPGGVMYLQTPRWSAMDRVAQRVADLSRGRLSRLLDRRLAEHHMVLHTRESLTVALQDAGLEVISIDATARYSLATSAYLLSLRIPGPVVKPLAWAIDRFLAAGWVPRNVWDAYARRPESAGS